MFKWSLNVSNKIMNLETNNNNIQHLWFLYQSYLYQYPTLPYNSSKEILLSIFSTKKTSNSIEICTTINLYIVQKS